MTATLEIRRGVHGPGTREVVADCDHGTTTMVIFDGPHGTIPDQAAARIVAARLLEEEQCRCARRLAKRYGVTA